MPIVLGSWKEIASHLGKGVRTVQRWERHCGLPVHRPSGSSKGVVLAFPAELDQWTRRQDAGVLAQHHFSRLTMQKNVELSHELMTQTRLLQERVSSIMKICSSVLEGQQRRRDGSAGETVTGRRKAAAQYPSAF
jgi:hypothetical protein